MTSKPERTACEECAHIHGDSICHHIVNGETCGCNVAPATAVDEAAEVIRGLK